VLAPVSPRDVPCERAQECQSLACVRRRERSARPSRHSAQECLSRALARARARARVECMPIPTQAPPLKRPVRESKRLCDYRQRGERHGAVAALARMPAAAPVDAAREI